jgi:hypothetical protein
MEAIIVVAFVILLLSLVLIQAIENNKDEGIMRELYKKHVVCNTVANSATEVFSAGEGARLKVNLHYAYNVTVYGVEGYLVVGDEPETIACNMPAGMMNSTLNFISSSLTFTNQDNMVVVAVG